MKSFKKFKLRLEDDYLVRVMFCSAIFLLLGIVGFWISNCLIDPLKNIISNISAVFIVSGVYNVIYEYLLKTKLIEIITKKMKLKSAIDQVGIENIGVNISEIDYKKLISNAKEIDIVHAYGEIWTKNFIEDIQKAINDHEVHIHVCLLSPTSDFCKSIEHHYKRCEGEMSQKINRMVGFWTRLKNNMNKKSSVEISFFDGNPVHTLYRFDDVIIYISNKITNSLSHELPYIICIKDPSNDKTLYGIFLKEINSIKEATHHEN